MQYTINVENSGIYDVTLGIATETQSSFKFQVNGADITSETAINSTGSWESWGSMSVRGLVLNEGVNKLRFKTLSGSFNMSRMNFTFVGGSSTIDTEYLALEASLDGSSIKLTVNKNLKSFENSIDLFSVSKSGVNQTITDVKLDSENSRIIIIELNDEINAKEELKVSYSGNTILAIDDNPLKTFSNLTVVNRIPQIHSIPGKIEAEDYSYNQGLSLEATSDAGGGENIGYTDAGDYLEFLVNISETVFYDVIYRVASQSDGGKIRLLELGDSERTLHTIDFGATGGWQNWENFTKPVYLFNGVYTLRLEVVESGFNLNYLLFSNQTTAIDDVEISTETKVYPNPGRGVFYIATNNLIGENTEVQIYNAVGQLKQEISQSNNGNSEDIKCDLSNYEDGIYIIKVRTKERFETFKVILKR